MLELTRTMLWRAGFSVVEASSAAQAIEVATLYPGQIHVLLTDVLMPETNGYDLAERLKAARPRLKVLFMSGYHEKVLAESTGRQMEGQDLLRKPFTYHTLIESIISVLAERPAGDQPEQPDAQPGA